ncbi:MAG: single-stranded DNA-binding protein [Acidobacteriia bacterium]|nr:single-stranded DNA-binding protein [Terriglobia bacterium]
MAEQFATPPTRPLESYLELIERILKEVLRAGRFELSFTIVRGTPGEDEPETPELVVDFAGPDADLLLEKNGALLNALEYVVLRAARLEEELFGRITFDSNDWRSLRAEELKLTARIAAERVIETGDPFALQPMSARERRIVHLALRDLPAVRTASEGAGADRKVVIHSASPPRRRR